MGGRHRRALAAAVSAASALALLTLAPAASIAQAASVVAPPTVTGPTGTVASTSATITVAKAHSSHTVSCFYLGEEINCPGTWTYTDLEQGPHAVWAHSTDTSGNASETIYLQWRVDTVGPVATTVAPNGLTTKAEVRFNEDAGGISGSSVRLVTDAGDPVPTSRSCVTLTAEVTPCSGNKVRKVLLIPDGGWVLGERYRTLVNPDGSATVVDGLGNVGAAKDSAFRVQTWTEEVGLNFGWRTVTNAKARGGTYLVERRPGAAVKWTFSGGSLTWTTVTGPAHGKAEVYVDGALRGTFNNYSERTRFGVERTLKGLGSGQHTVEVRALGKKGARAGTDKLVAVDGFVTADGSVATPDVAQHWQRLAAGAASNGYYSVAELAGQSATTSFRGTSVTLHTAMGPRYGEVQIVVDGEVRKTVDLYAPSLAFGEQVTVSGLSDSRHTLEVRVLGTKRAASSGTAVVVDRISVG